MAGHSLGGAVAAVLQEDALAGRLSPSYRGFREVRTYGAPLLHSDQIPNLHAYRRAWDPFFWFGQRCSNHQRAELEPAQLPGLQ